MHLIQFFSFHKIELGLSVKTLKMFYLYFYQVDISSSDLTNYGFWFLDSVPTFMEMGFVKQMPSMLAV